MIKKIIQLILVATTCVMFEAFIAHTVVTTGFEITLTQEKIYERLEGNATNFDCSRIFFYLFILHPSVQF